LRVGGKALIIFRSARPTAKSGEAKPHGSRCWPQMASQIALSC
jgi:hypothetical protein